jgi:hypothetical protein
MVRRNKDYARSRPALRKDLCQTSGGVRKVRHLAPIGICPACKSGRSADLLTV